MLVGGRSLTPPGQAESIRRATSSQGLKNPPYNSGALEQLPAGRRLDMQFVRGLLTLLPLPAQSVYSGKSPDKNGWRCRPQCCLR